MEARAAVGWRRFGFVICGVCLAAGLAAGSGVRAWAQAVAPQTTLTGELQSLASRAATVFAGQVVSIERKGGVVEITFRVDEAVVGQPGAGYTLREWAGLWPPGQFRYTVGERALIFLHAASAAGLGSPVDGAEGVVPILVQGANAPALLDIRRMSSALLRKVGTPLATEANGAIQLSDAVAVITAAHGTGAPRPVAPVQFRLPSRGTPPRMKPIPEPLAEGMADRERDIAMPLEVGASPGKETR